MQDLTTVNTAQRIEEWVSKSAADEFGAPVWTELSLREREKAFVSSSKSPLCSKKIHSLQVPGQVLHIPLTKVALESALRACNRAGATEQNTFCLNQVAWDSTYLIRPGAPDNGEAIVQVQS